VDSNPVIVTSRARRSVRVLIPEGVGPDRSYELEEEIGRGAAATVWRGRDRTSGREVAVKVLHEEHMGHPKAVKRFLEERSILMSLRHPNIVRVRDLLTTGDGTLALVMDLVHGGNLREYLAQRRTLPAAEAAALLAQVADALRVAHARSVVHRDLKPDNVLVDRATRRSQSARTSAVGRAAGSWSTQDWISCHAGRGMPARRGAAPRCRSRIALCTWSAYGGRPTTSS